MWLITPRGFYSAVAKPGDGDEFVTVRARSEQDIRNLADLIDAEPTSGAGTDYRWRLRFTKKEWAKAVKQMAIEIDYDNFKNRIARTDPGRARVLSRVWSDVLAIQESTAEQSADLVARMRYLLWRQDEIRDELGDEGIHPSRSDREDVGKDPQRRDELRAEWQDLEKEIKRLSKQIEEQGASLTDG